MIKNTLLIIVFLLFSQSCSHASKIDFWNTQQKGANNFNHNETKEDWYKAASEYNIQWVRLAFGGRPNFLIGSVDNYKGLVYEDLEELKRSIAAAKKYNIKIALVPIALMGATFRQHNNYKNDMRLWTDKKYWEMVANFWQDMAREFKDNDTVVAYNIFNEPYPEFGVMKEHSLDKNDTRFKNFIDEYKGTARDLSLFYKVIIEHIRAVDKHTPIMIESGWYAQPSAFTYIKPFKDKKILYQFHMYEPYSFTSGHNFRKKKNLEYPGNIPFADTTVYWNISTIKQYLQPFRMWAKENNIPSNRIVVGEFGCMRRNKGCEKYLQDVMSVFNENKYHWAFYTFRGDSWDGYDYEAGSKAFSWQYWKDLESGKNPKRPYYKNALWDAIIEGLHYK